MTETFDLVVIGGGVGGLVTASVAGQLGLRVALVEKSGKLGGDCLHTGCVPSKTLIRSAEIAWAARESGRFGVAAELGRVDLAAVMDRVREVIDTIQVHDDPERFRSYGVDVIFAHARFADAQTVVAGDRRLIGRRILIATGSRPAVPLVPGLAEAGYWTNETVFDQRELPDRLAVMGGGPIGLELAQAFARLGSQVTVLEMAERILPREDPELTAELERQLRADGVDVRTATAVEAVETRDGMRRLHCRSGDEVATIEADHILVAAGRAPKVDGLDLERAGVTVEEGRIPVDARMRTSVRHIHACGDVCGTYPFTHVVEYQAGVVIANVVFRLPKKADYRVIPWVTYTAPELAHVGLTEAAAREQGYAVQIARFRFGDVDRALAEGSTAGLLKMVIYRGRILGASILGPHAGELIHELVLAMQARIKVKHLSGAVHAYPTLAQIHRRAVNTLYADRLYSPMTRRVVGWIQRLVP
ncbi:dihydrolipoyl dehydrogenase family protein [Aquisalimonas asiatica]|uniref:Pyruvate/2-oxoglutarate dehydrogenase complex, dihydrolipoamide dehydrogenase (E3) component n=1 Tax=Aquisalimonas asiatica TaxID=406100 RepID=A0A1H8SLF9_9GAMM|nr:FAD-dependent oxidoreductase [Aquisalimonas asiatica]SEO79128.1 Pyruvate/2-oxoglutarate dehydrogenase complex, dihydrolipoamide dehydrogenase (E3) component [Aquisalimonas asiatica]